MNTDKFIRLNTVFKLPKDVAKEAISLSYEVGQKNESFFILEGIKFHPHITIYSPEYPESNIDKVLKIVEEVADNTTKTKLIFQHVKSNDGYVGVYFELLPEIKNLHKEIVAKLNPLRGGRLREKYQYSSDYHINFSPKQLENIKKYGYPDAMDLYHPHLTIIRLKKKSSAETIANNLSWRAPQFIVDKLAVYTMGEHGTCKELVKEFSLKQVLTSSARRPS